MTRESSPWRPETPVNSGTYVIQTTSDLVGYPIVSLGGLDGGVSVPVVLMAPSGYSVISP